MVVCTKCAREFETKKQLEEHKKLPACDFKEQPAQQKKVK